MNTKDHLPELLAPAGDYTCFEAALSAGADAVYMGGTGFNARAYAGGFTDDEIKNAFRLSRLYGKKIYITLNTLVFDKEMKDALSLAEKLISYGADTFIVQDLGLAENLKKTFPDVTLHASTQMTCVNSDGVKKLTDSGFSRVVIAREVPKKDLAEIASKTNTELEYFVHGALCVSVSGQCLFSSVVGKRSGNRGECAQPCRMCYNSSTKSDYPLSLKDNFLGQYIKELSDMGIASLKVEGRMKSPEYVYGVVSAYRKAIDEQRNMTDKEKADLSSLFSRSGFTDRYFSAENGGSHFSMIGIRTEKDKERSAKAENEIKKIKKTLPKREVDITCTVSKDMTFLSLSDGESTVYATERGCDEALNRPTTEEEVKLQLEKLGDTPFKSRNTDISVEGSLMIPKSLLNSLRREASEKLTDELTSFAPLKKLDANDEISEKHTAVQEKNTAVRFIFGAQDPSSDVINAIKEAISKNKTKEFEIFLPLFADDRVFSALSTTNANIYGAQMPPIFFDSERDGILKRLEKLYETGLRHILCENIGDMEILRELEEKGMKMTLHAGSRFNIANSHTCNALSDFGFESVTLSREINEKGAKYTGLDSNIRRGAVLYGYAPLMLLQRCLYRDMKGCTADIPWNKCTCSLTLKDRTKAEFFTLSAFGHRNTLYNSVATLRPDALKSGFDFAVFTVTKESAKDIKDILYNLFNGKEMQGYTAR